VAQSKVGGRGTNPKEKRSVTKKSKIKTNGKTQHFGRRKRYRGDENGAASPTILQSEGCEQRPTGRRRKTNGPDALQKKNKMRRRKDSSLSVNLPRETGPKDPGGEA